MKKPLLCIFTTVSTALIAQQAPTGSPPANNVNSQAGSAWYRGGNPNANVAGNNNLFGTLWNSPIYTTTGGTIRMKLNGSLNYPVDGLDAARSGYLLLGNNVPINNNLFNSSNKGAFSMLHLAGRDGDFVQEFGYRTWMKTGITFTDNTDLSYIGLRQVGNDYDKTETTITWADNATGIDGPDDMVFRFTGWNNAGSGTVLTQLI